MNQIWFGLIWISPKESKTQGNKTKKDNVFQTSLDMPRSK